MAPLAKASQIMVNELLTGQHCAGVLAYGERVRALTRVKPGGQMISARHSGGHVICDLHHTFSLSPIAFEPFRVRPRLTVCGKGQTPGFQQLRRPSFSPKPKQKEKQNVEETDDNDTGGHGTHDVRHVRRHSDAGFRWRSKRPLHQGVQPSARAAQVEER